MRGYCLLLGVVGACGRWGFAPTATGDGAIGDGVVSIDGTGDGAPTSDGPAGMTPDASMVPVDAASGTQVPPANADTYIKGIDNTTHGADAMTYVGRYTGNGTNMFVLLQFDLAGVTTCSKATLRVYQYTSVGTSAFPVRVQRLTQVWDEASADWSNASTGVAWTSGGGGTVASTTYGSLTITPGAYGFYDFDVTTVVSDWLAGATNDGLLLDPGSQPPTGDYIGFATRENSNAAWHPQLLITP